MAARCVVCVERLNSSILVRRHNRAEYIKIKAAPTNWTACRTFRLTRRRRRRREIEEALKSRFAPATLRYRRHSSCYCRLTKRNSLNTLLFRQFSVFFLLSSRLIISFRPLFSLPLGGSISWKRKTMLLGIQHRVPNLIHHVYLPSEFFKWGDRYVLV